VLDLTVMSHHTSVSNCFYYVVTIALSVLTDRLICTEYLCLQKATAGHAPGPAVRVDEPSKGNLGFIHAFVAALSVIIVSELGDKTFFIAAIMAMRYNRLTVLVGAMLALGLMTCLSVLFGYATTIIPRIYTYYISTALFAIFGVRMLREGLRMSPDEGQEELEEVQCVCSHVWLNNIHCIIEAFYLTFDCQRRTRHGIAVGGTLGHCLCTGLAVIGGRMVAQKISVRTVTIIGGIVFLAFAFSALFIKPDSGF
uniref:GDT1 family protein n=1 Tax=Sinocyclocheilus grahami TaxID=75366 RepID=A0A672KMF4_SINGR